MGDSSHIRAEDESGRLRAALEAETERCLALQRQIDQASANFEEFISLAAHNLREPLRQVASFSQLLSETAAARLDPEAREFLAHILDGAGRAEALLADIVNFWAVGSGGGQDSSTDMEAVLRQALLASGALVASRGAIVTHDALPAARGDFAVLVNVLRHLIRNAIQYCAAPVARIHISSRRIESAWVFTVQDNGPGIEPAFRERVFAPFKRLHGREHPGNGLGLAYCRNAIDALGGKIWIESAPEPGSVFCFTLPANG